MPGRHLPSAAEGFTGGHRHVARTRHPHSRLHRIRRRNRPPRRLDGAVRRNFLTADTAQMTAETRDQTLSGRGRYANSTLDSAVAGQAVAAAADLSYAELMRTRLFEPLGMSHTAIEVGTHSSPAGGPNRSPGPALGHGGLRPRRRRGLHHRGPRETRHCTPRRDRPWHGRPGAHNRYRPVEHPHRGLLVTSTWQTGQTITHHAGQTSGYASYLGIDRTGHKAVIVLSDIANNAGDLGGQLLAHRSRPPTPGTGLLPPDRQKDDMLVDSTAPAAAKPRATPPSDGGSYDLSSRVSALVSTSARLGLGRLVGKPTASALPARSTSTSRGTHPRGKRHPCVTSATSHWSS